jgi:hypothetical protein
MVQTGRLENIRDSATGTIGQRCGGSVECRSDVNHLACKQLGRGGGFAAQFSICIFGFGLFEDRQLPVDIGYRPSDCRRAILRATDRSLGLVEHIVFCAIAGERLRRAAALDDCCFAFGKFRRQAVAVCFRGMSRCNAFSGLALKIAIVHADLLRIVFDTHRRQRWHARKSNEKQNVYLGWDAPRRC